MCDSSYLLQKRTRIVLCTDRSTGCPVQGSASFLKGCCGGQLFSSHHNYQDRARGSHAFCASKDPQSRRIHCSALPFLGGSGFVGDFPAGDAAGIETGPDGTLVAICPDGYFWPGPSCRADPSKCVPYFTQQPGWGVEDAMQKAGIGTLNPISHLNAKNRTATRSRLIVRSSWKQQFF